MLSEVALRMMLSGGVWGGFCSRFTRKRLPSEVTSQVKKSVEETYGRPCAANNGIGVPVASAASTVTVVANTVPFGSM